MLIIMNPETTTGKIKSAVHRQGLQKSVNDKNGKKLES